jgi:hypothetical protein
VPPPSYVLFLFRFFNMFIIPAMCNNGENDNGCDRYSKRRRQRLQQRRLRRQGQWRPLRFFLFLYVYDTNYILTATMGSGWRGHVRGTNQQAGDNDDDDDDRGHDAAFRSGPEVLKDENGAASAGQEGQEHG